MDLQETMKEKVFVVVGNTVSEEKYAYIIKKRLLEKGYTVYSVPKEYESINDVPDEIDVIDLCIHPVKGLRLIKECKKEYKNIVIQPGAESEEILTYLRENSKPFTESCLLVGLSVYTN
ncbi:MAG TPA: CoA-binding protein [Anaerovoracaceae bacterium]|nr:CoA-binding protein [Anaerovoracaceae bacterium]